MKLPLLLLAIALLAAAAITTFALLLFVSAVGDVSRVVGP